MAQSAPDAANRKPDAEHVGSTEDLAAQVRDLRATDPGAAIALAEPAFNAAVGNERIAIGLELAEAYIGIKRVDDAKLLIETLAGDPATTTTEQARLTRLRLLLATASGVFDRVDAIANGIDAVAAATEDRLVRAELWSQLGMVRLVQAKFPDAEFAYRHAIDEAGKNDSPLRFELLQRLGIALAQQGRYADALESFASAEAVANRMGLGDDPNFLLRYAGVFIYTEDPAHAILYLNRALAAAEANPAKSVYRIPIYNNLGTAYYGQKNYEQAAHWFETSLAYAKENGGNTGHTLNNLGAVLREWGRDREALAKFEEARKIAVDLKDKEGRAVADKNIGETLIKLGQRALAVKPLERAYAIYAETDQRPKWLELYPVMIDNFEALGRDGDALRLMREFKALSDDVVNVDSRERISKLESAIDLAEKQKQLAATELDSADKSNAIEKLESQRGIDQNINRWLIAAVTALVILIVLQVRDRSQKSQAHSALTLKSEQIEQQRRSLESLNEVVRRQSQEDVLTGLKNRRYLAEWMAETNQRRASDAGHGRLSTLLIMIDLDYFKSINDRFGHAAGDNVLVEFAGILRDCRRDSDLVVRWGGEEFVWVCPDTTVDAAPVLCNRIRDALAARQIIVDGVEIALTVSMGFAAHPLWPERSGDWQLSMRVADAAMYESKANGRNHWLGYAAGTTPEKIVPSSAEIVDMTTNGNLRRIPMQG